MYISLSSETELLSYIYWPFGYLLFWNTSVGFFYWVVCFYLLICRNSLYTLNEPFVPYLCCKYFLLMCGLSFLHSWYFLMNKHLNVVQFIFFFLFCVFLKTSLHATRSWKYVPTCLKCIYLRSIWNWFLCMCEIWAKIPSFFP